MNIGIYGYGRFGSFLANKLSHHFNVIVTNITLIETNNIPFLMEKDFFNTDFDIVIFANSINSFESVIKRIQKDFFKNKLIVEVLSVKEYPFSVFETFLPPQTEIMLTHPMFGPDSDSVSHSKKLVYYPVNITNFTRANLFLDFWKEWNCELICMSPTEHDYKASKSQFITHFIGRVLNELKLEETEIDTSSFTSLLNLVKIVNSDTTELFLGIARKNKHTHELIESFKLAVSKIELEIFGD
jgi:prephenate dehydrogenase